MKNAELMVIVGYSFNRVDNHFNELFVAESAGKKVAIINPDLEGTKSSVCALLGLDPQILTKQTIDSISVQSTDSLLFVPSTSEDMNPEMLAKIQSGW